MELKQFLYLTEQICLCILVSRHTEIVFLQCLLPGRFIQGWETMATV